MIAEMVGCSFFNKIFDFDFFLYRRRAKKMVISISELYRTQLISDVA
jgi:hypothetical protein